MTRRAPSPHFHSHLPLLVAIIIALHKTTQHYPFKTIVRLANSERIEREKAAINIEQRETTTIDAAQENQAACERQGTQHQRWQRQRRRVATKSAEITARWGKEREAFQEQEQQQQ